MKFKASQIAQLVGGTLTGDPDVWVSKPSKIEEGSPESISFLGNMKYEHFAYTCASSVLLVAHNFEPKQTIKATLIKVEDVYTALAVLMEHFARLQQTALPTQIAPQAYVHPQAKIGAGVRIDAFAYVEKGAIVADKAIIYPHCYVGEGVEIGAETILHSGVKVYRDCRLGSRVIIHANTVIGSDGFGFAPQSDGSYKKIPQLGNVIIENGVEIGANTVIDRATMNATLIEEGAKLDNLIQVAHNVKIGKNTVMASQVGVAGSTQIGESCMIGGQVGFAGHLKIANRTKIQAQSGIGQSVKKEDTAIWGSPAIDYKKYYRCAIVFKNLPELQKQVDKIQKILDKRP